jgi:protein-L-isoaspartate(D-aspartate) O-methyltransferase
MQEKDELIDYWRNHNTITDERLLQAFVDVHRENFVLEKFLDRTYEDLPLPILAGQTISQPTTVLLMLQALELKPEDIVLEIGSGSGYNAALMSKLCKKVISSEIIDEMVQFAKQNLAKEGIRNVTVVKDDGTLNHKKYGHFDKIIVTCGSKSIPRMLIDQLKEGGLMIIPVGPIEMQEMLKIKKEKDGLRLQNLGNYMFVPLKGEYGY